MVVVFTESDIVIYVIAWDIQYYIHVVDVGQILSD